METENVAARNLRRCRVPEAGFSLPRNRYFPNPSIREAAENTTLGYMVFRAEKTTSSEPLYLFYFSESEFENPHYQSIRPATEDNILPSLRCQDESSSLLEKTPEPILQSTGVSFQIQDSSLQLPDGNRISSQDVDFVFERKGRPPKPDRPSASEKKFPCEFCEKRYGTKQSLQVESYNVIDVIV